MPTCKNCDSEVTALHYGGDANIPPPGLCDDCQVVEARAALADRQAKQDTAVEAKQRATVAANPRGSRA